MEYFIKKAIAIFPLKIELPQTDNGTEWTNALMSNDPTPTLFKQMLTESGTVYNRMWVATPRHNGKVEWQQIDQKRFYGKLQMYSLKDGQKQFRRYDCFFNAIQNPKGVL